MVAQYKKIINNINTNNDNKWWQNKTQKNLQYTY